MSTTNRTTGNEANFVPPLMADEPSHPGLAPGLAGLRLAPDEFDAINYEDCEPGYRYELIRGVVVVNPIPSEAHDDPNEVLGDILRAYRRSHPNGKMLDKTMQNRYVYVANGRRIADRVVWIGLGRNPRVKTEVPAIVIEFVSYSRRDWLRDYVEKRDEYLAAGVKEYWVIDRFQRTLTVFQVEFEKVRETVVPESATYQTPLLPGFVLPLAEILQVADEWKDEDE